MTGVAVVSSGCRGGRRKGEEEKQCQLSLFTLVADTFRKSMAQCHLREEGTVIDIGWPSEVHHVAHVTFDRFHGFLGLPVEFELEIPSGAPSASVNVFGVSPESMQCGYDSKGNSVPTILLLMQKRLYCQGGLKAEGIFRINPENDQEKEVRENLNKGILPDVIDVHCLAGLIKAWFRELPEGVMDTLSPGQVLQCESEDDYAELVKLLPPTQYALVIWTIELMADVAEEVESNKMNARNIAMVFAPNMTQLLDPLTSLIHAVQVMNLLKALILRTLREREEQIFWPFPYSSLSSEEAITSESSEEDLSIESTTYDDENRVSFNSEKDEEESSGFQSDSKDDCCSITRELVRDIEECFLKQLEMESKIENYGLLDNDSSSDQATQFSFSNSKAESSFSLSESNHSNDEVSSRRILVSDAVKMIEGYAETTAERNDQSLRRNEVLFGTIVVRDVVKVIEENEGMRAELNQNIEKVYETNTGKNSVEDPDCEDCRDKM